jgi:hypothetical protein
MANEDKAKLGARVMVMLALRNPVGFAIYSAVAVAVRLGDRRRGAGAGAAVPDWSRGR